MYKRKRINKKYSAEFKICVILDKAKNNLGVKETVRKYGLKSHNTLKQRQRGYEDDISIRSIEIYRYLIKNLKKHYDSYILRQFFMINNC